MAAEPKAPYSDSDSDSLDSLSALETARSSPLPQLAPSSTPRPTSAFQTSQSYADDAIFDFEPPSETHYPPASIKSANASREAQFEQDTDELLPEEGGDGEEAVLMEGLIQSSRRRGSVDLGIPTEGPRPEKGSGILAGIANMSNSILGAGIIGLPFALREAGFVCGIILLIALGMVTNFTLRLIVLNAKMSGRNSYIDIMDACFGKHGRFLVSFFQFTFAFGGMCAFCVIIGDTIPHVLVAIIPDTTSGFVNFLVSRHFVIAVLTMGVSYPLSLYRDIDKLSPASALALVSMVVIICSVILKGPTVDESLRGSHLERFTFINTEVFESISIISFAFVCHHNSLLIYGSLRTPTIDRFARVTHVSTLLSVIACLCMSISGFLVFTDKTQANILNNFPSDDFMINVARACFGANMATTTPLEAFVCREVLENFFWPGREYSQKRHIVITTCLVFSAMTVALITCDLGLILELAGGGSATALAYIFPSFCYLSLTQHSKTPHSKSTKWTRIAAWLCAVFGIAVAVLSTSLSIMKAVSGKRGTKVC